jgi:hypothetical protein
MKYRSIDVDWDDDFQCKDGIIDFYSDKGRHFLAEVNRVPYLIKKNIAFDSELAERINYGHIKVQVPVLESDFTHEKIREFLIEFRKTRKFDEMSSEYRQNNYNIYLLSEGKFHHKTLPAVTCVRQGEVYFVKWCINGVVVKKLDETFGGENLGRVRRICNIADDGEESYVIGKEAELAFEEINGKLVKGDLYEEFCVS